MLLICALQHVLAAGLRVLAYELMVFGLCFLGAHVSWLIVITLISLHQNRPGGMREAIESAAPGFARVPGVFQIPE